ncbi:MAG: MFS transporter [Xenococcaceae cyanobacterium MO_188.B29]|nr:MFS transporter [Xenococcaceae cyanobacterium MO_188.B29]
MATFVGIGYVFSSFATNISILIFTYGVLVGTGGGMVYGVPMVIAARWFPDRQGLAAGLTIIGFGLSPIMTAPLVEALIDGYGFKQTLLVLGIAFTVELL